jgi:hypothetical protein
MILRWVYKRFLSYNSGSRIALWLVRRSHVVRRLIFWITVLLYPFFCLLSWLRLLGRRLLGLKPAVLWGPTPILTIAESSAILRRLGYPSTTLVFTTYYIADDFDINLKSLVAEDPAVSYWLPNVLFLWALLKFDIFHFFYDGGVWSGMKIVPQAKWLELPLLRLAGKRIIASAYGADVRVKGLNEAWQPYNICQECPEPGLHCICDRDRGTTNAKYHRDWCNVLLAMGDMYDFVFGSRKDFNYWPIDVQKIAYVGAKPHAGPVRVVHSPNHRYFKGTRFIEAAVSTLQAKGYELELILVERVSNTEAKRQYAEADIVVAQCLAGWVGYTEIEAMAAGKPVVSYLRNADYLAHAPGCPIISANPDSLAQALEQLVCDPVWREELGRRGRAYVEREWSYEALAPRYEALHQEVWHNNRLGQALRAKWVDFVWGEVRCRVGTPHTGPHLKEWPVYSDPFVAMRRIDAGCYGQPPFDAQGMPRVFHHGGYVVHPGAVASYALHAFHGHLAEPEHPAHITRFQAAAAWLRDHLEIDAKGVGRWLHNFEVSGRDLKRPWVSCVSQSVGLSILLRADQMAPGAGFDQCAHAAAVLFRVPVQDGGVLWVEDEQVYLESYPESAPSHGLSDFITGMFGLHEYARVTGQAWARSLFAQGVQTLSKVIRLYETANGLYDDLRHDTPIKLDDYYVIVQQLRALRVITGEHIFHQYAQRWSCRLYQQKCALFFKGAAPW